MCVSVCVLVRVWRVCDVWITPPKPPLSVQPPPQKTPTAYEHKPTVSLEEFQALFAWVAGLHKQQKSALSVKAQLTALVGALKARHGQGRGDVSVYLTTANAEPLRKPGDFYLRASTTQPGWIAIEYLAPPTAGVSESQRVGFGLGG